MDKYKRQIILGDIHGCYQELMNLLEKLEFSPVSDRLIFAGDLVDRGPQSGQVVRWVREHNEKYPENVQCIMGNHDLKYYRLFQHNQRALTHPGYKIPMHELSSEKKEIFQSLSSKDLEWIGKLPYYLSDNELGKWIVVHAGLVPNVSLWNQPSDRLCHIRFVDVKTNKLVKLNGDYTNPEGSQFWTDLYKDQWNVVYGHTVHSMEEPNIEKKENGTYLVGIDTGCCFGGVLTAFIIPSDPTKVIDKSCFVQVKADKTHYKSFIKSSWKRRV